MKRFWRVRGLWLLVAVAFLAGCAAGGPYQGAGSVDTSVRNIPPAFYNVDPGMRVWYSAPYFMPYESP
jgi:hypothetical protein